MNRIFINDVELKVNNWNLNLLQFCEEVDLVIPRFCYHDELSVAGNCRMCLIEVVNSPKPVISCGCMLMKEMKVYTNSDLVKKAREYVMEFLLINHPLDCPICDQGGECDLQDQSFVYGSDRGRFKEIKRAVEDIELGPFIKTIMTRCIHCTRCVRFSQEILNIHSVSMLGRGRESEIGTYVKQPYFHELSGNVIDLCPVGALTSRPYTFSARPWELFSMETIDILSPFCSDIKVDIKGNEVMRILPVVDSTFKTDWITDSIRFCFDALKTDRLVNPMYLDTSEQYFYSCSWSLVSFFFSSTKLRSSFVLGDSCDLETLYLLQTTNSIVPRSKCSNLFPNVLNPEMISENANAVSFMLLNINLKKENAMLDLLLKKKSNTCNFFYFGKFTNFNYNIIHVSLHANSFFYMLQGRSFVCSKILKNVVFFSNEYFSNLNKLSSFFEFSKHYTLASKVSKWNNYLLGDTRRTTNYFVLETKPDMYVFLNTDSKHCFLKNNMLSVYIGHSLSSDSTDSNIILPCTTFLEENTHYINLAGICKSTTIVLDSLDLCASMKDILASLFNTSSLAKVPSYVTSNIFVFWKYIFNYKKYNVSYCNKIPSFSYCNHLISKKSISLQKAEFDKKKYIMSSYNFL